LSFDDRHGEASPTHTHDHTGHAAGRIAIASARGAKAAILITHHLLHERRPTITLASRCIDALHHTPLGEDAKFHLSRLRVYTDAGETSIADTIFMLS
jgi:hypothetical protein